MNLKNIFVALLVGIGIYTYIQDNPAVISLPDEESVQTEQAVFNAYQNRLSDVQVNGSGEVARILSDDNKGSRHQRFILRLSSGQSVLIAHNIDLSPRIATLKKGDVVHFFGEYEWNSKGGVVHWTHHDPGGRHVGGWLKHAGKKYE